MFGVYLILSYFFINFREYNTYFKILLFEESPPFVLQQGMIL